MTVQTQTFIILSTAFHLLPGTKFGSYVGYSLILPCHIIVFFTKVKCTSLTFSENSALYIVKTSPRISNLRSLLVGVSQTDVSFDNPTRKRFKLL